ncbi:MAG: hypothetical protein UV80_C0007G0036 [Candidatus Peregrinibacteria bacterium GW2011_GWF2_43_17]|nr:MAG: hypothetical protein UV80_C0007G0036 [Candidatus Peregrinibacteria bacterium GW2011_GWF2_43_17]KKT18679.1 MAG: hypothetical protein UW03_C0034G0008 [Candidatus Peregrinibacteria bacterium GW2011_GWA2_43_8]HAU39578.1 hypothetical protein [Candidatus Peregrinibacteria bacterium]
METFRNTRLKYPDKLNEAAIVTAVGNILAKLDFLVLYHLIEIDGEARTMSVKKILGFAITTIFEVVLRRLVPQGNMGACDESVPILLDDIGGQTREVRVLFNQFLDMFSDMIKANCEEDTTAADDNSETKEEVFELWMNIIELALWELEPEFISTNEEALTMELHVDCKRIFNSCGAANRN